ncbi:MAG: Lrp/AsnC ligand binding domain-containing protein [Candidatus Heimdallarchaeota archaeon]|nr:Lrp/AsnC ligand binding domain-containing protein [Candidatus Heimdallarchaeota archaeon]MDH5644810.1 Lrp/AsnC ligand binding domain-containing protein [Candidatus Heimdallarchaeota archaeon]
MASAYILINTEVANEIEVLELLKKYPEVKEAHIVYGVYDIIAQLEAETLRDIKEGILNEIRKIKKIRNTVSMIVAE